jgi:hypothetical protein
MIQRAKSGLLASADFSTRSRATALICIQFNSRQTKSKTERRGKRRMNRALVTSAATALLLGGSMIFPPVVVGRHRLIPYHSQIDRIASPTPDSLVLNASFENGLTVWNNWYGKTSLITSGQRSGTGALQVAAGSAEYQDVSARVQPGHTYQLTGYMKVLNSEAVPNAGIGIQGWDSSSHLRINTVIELAAYSTSYQQVSTTFTVPTGVTGVWVIAEDWDNSYSSEFDDFQLVDSSGPTTQPSASGATVSTTTSLIDSTGNTWTISSGVVDRNGAAAGTASNITLLCYFKNVVYAEDASGNWTSWNGSSWASTTDPRVCSGNTGLGGASGGGGGGTGGSTGSSTTISADWATYNLSGGPFWALNSVWNKRNLVNGKDYIQSLTLDNAKFPNNSVITWNWPNTPTSGNVYSGPGVFYGNYTGFPPPATSIPSTQINNINTLTVSHDVSLSGITEQYDAIYDMYLTSTPDAPSLSGALEVEVDIHTPSYMSSWIQRMSSQKTFIDSQGLQWTIAQAKPNMVLFVPSDFRDLTNYTFDLKALLKAAVADGYLTGNEYFNGFGFANEPREGSGSMTINSLSVTYN